MPGLRLVLALATHILETASFEIVVISMQWCYAARNKVRRSFGITLIDDACLEYAILVAPNAKKRVAECQSPDVCGVDLRDHPKGHYAAFVHEIKHQSPGSCLFIPT